jgi:autotransporter translocation and assembly factor TamB
MASDWKKARKIALSIFLLFLALFLLIVYLRYLDLKKAFIEKASEKASSVIGQRVRIKNLSISLLGAVNLYDITIRNPEGFASGQLLRIRRLHLDVRPSELLKGRFSLRNIILFSH